MQTKRRPPVGNAVGGAGSSCLSRTGEAVLRGTGGISSPTDLEKSRALIEQEEILAEESLAAVENVEQALRQATRKRRGGGDSRSDREASSAETSNDASTTIVLPAASPMGPSATTGRRGCAMARAYTQGTEASKAGDEGMGFSFDDDDDDDDDDSSSAMFGPALSSRGRGGRPLRRLYGSGTSQSKGWDFNSSLAGPSSRRRTSAQRGFSTQFFASYTKAGQSTKWDPAWLAPVVPEQQSPNAGVKPIPPTSGKPSYTRRSQMAPAPSLAMHPAPSEPPAVSTIQTSGGGGGGAGPIVEKSTESTSVAGMAAMRSLSVFAGSLRRHSVNEVPAAALPSSVNTCSPQPSLSARSRRDSQKKEPKCMRREEVQRLLQSGQRAKAEACLRQLGAELPRPDNSLLLKATLKAMSAQRRELAEARHTLQEMLLAGSGSKNGPTGIMGDRLRVTICEDSGCSPFFGSGKRITLAFGRQKSMSLANDAEPAVSNPTYSRRTGQFAS